MNMDFAPKVGYITLVHRFEEGADKAAQVYNQGLKKLNPYHYEIVTSKEPISSTKQAIEIGNQFLKSNIDVIIIRLATWCSDNLLLDIIAILDVPVVCWGIPDVNSGSMCGAQQFNSVLKELNKTCRFIYGDKTEALDKLDAFIKIIAVRKRLKTLRVGLIGNRTQGMAEIICDETSLREVIGPRVESMGWEEFDQIVKNQTISNENAIIEKINQLKRDISTISVSDEDLKQTVLNYLVLKNIVKEKQLDAATIECYPNHMGQLCVAFSLLADEKIVCACEADLNSAVLMWIMRQLSAGPVHHIDPLSVDESEDTIVGSHCGSGVSRVQTGCRN
jgi:L-fucose isomerase-like protein